MTGASRVLVVGSVNVDLVVHADRLPGPGETVLGGRFARGGGGKSANQAVAAALLGADVALLGRVGDDPHGTLLVMQAQRAGVDTRHVVALDDVATGTAVIAVDAAGENFILVSPGANGRLRPADVEAAADFFSGAAVLCLCLEVDQAVVQAAADQARKAGAQVVLNLSPFADVSAELLGLTDVLVVNEHELADLVGRDTVGDGDEPDWLGVAQALGGRGPYRLIVTLGAGGAAVLDLAGSTDVYLCRVPAPAVSVVDTTGCGDAFLGALAYRLAVGDDAEAACRFAVGVGSLAATRPGAQASYPTAAELRAFIA